MTPAVLTQRRCVLLFWNPSLQLTICSQGTLEFIAVDVHKGSYTWPRHSADQAKILPYTVFERPDDDPVSEESCVSTLQTAIKYIFPYNVAFSNTSASPANLSASPTNLSAIRGQQPATSVEYSTVKHAFHYDVESFLWLFIWIFSQRVTAICQDCPPGVSALFSGDKKLRELFLLGSGEALKNWIEQLGELFSGLWDPLQQAWSAHRGVLKAGGESRSSQSAAKEIELLNNLVNSVNALLQAVSTKSGLRKLPLKTYKQRLLGKPIEIVDGGLEEQKRAKESMPPPHQRKHPRSEYAIGITPISYSKRVKTVKTVSRRQFISYALSN